MIDSRHTELPNEDWLRTEYEACQASAQHHDQLVWTITTILWASSLVLLGFVINAMRQPGLQWPLTAVGGLAIALTGYLWRCASQLGDVRRQKYKRCIAIEERFGLRQHSALNYPSGSQTTWYSVVMIFYLMVWIAFIVFVWAAPPTNKTNGVGPRQPFNITVEHRSNSVTN